MSIGLGGGSDREWLEPLDSEGNRNPGLDIEDRLVGSHTAEFAGLNVFNPRPGFEYAWLIDPNGHLGGTSAALAINSIGGVIVREGDDEYSASSVLQGLHATGVDTNATFNELVLIRIPVERQRQRMQEHLDKNSRMLRKGPEESFINAASYLEGERYSDRGPTRFAMRGHQTQFKHGNDTVEVSLPDSGIVRTE